MRMASHIDHIAQEYITRVIGMQRIDLRVLGSGQIVDVIALNGLIEKRKPDQQDNRDDDREPGRGAGFQSAALALLLSGFHRSTGRRAAETSSTRLVRVLWGAVRTSSGSLSTSRAIEIKASAKRSSSRLPSVSVGSI